MKHKLLFALAGALMSMSAMAWDAPTKPSMPTLPEMPSYEGSWVTPENEGIYYIYNVGTGQFLGSGLNWATRAVVAHENVVAMDDAEPTKIDVGRSSGTNNPTRVLPFKISHPDASILEADNLGEEFAETWFIQNQNTDFQDYYLCHEGNSAWIDGGDSRRATDHNGYWKIEAAEGGYHLLPTDNNSLVFGVHLINMDAVVSYVWTDLKNDETAAAIWKFVSSDDAESVKSYCEEVADNAETYTAAMAAYKENLTSYNEAIALYNAKLALYNTLLDADKYGADATEAGAVYNNPDATVEELNAANTALKEAIAPLAIEYGCTHSSEEEPFEVTSYVMTNPDFSASCDNGKTPPGWEITITGQNIGQQNRTDTNGETGLAITNFLECWIPQPGTLGNGYAGQWITGLPQGRYRLEMDATACQQSGAIAIEDLVGVTLFVGTGSYNIIGDPVQTAEYAPQHYTFDFDFNADKLLVGLLVENTNCNWISADNFRLYAIGAMKEDPNKKGLEEAIERAQAIADNLVGNDIEDASVFNVNAEVAQAFQQTLEDAQAALSGTGDDMKAAVEALGAATEAANQSNALYKQFQEVYNNALLAAQTFKDNNNQWPDLQDQINDYAEVDLAEAFNAGTLTEDDLEEAQGKVDQLIADYLNDPEKIQPGDDLTALIKNADFSKGSGRDLTGDAVPGWTIVSGQLTELSGTYHNIERYHGSVNIQQTIKNLPAGSYQIGVQGFVRIDGGENDMVLYAGISEKKFMEITEESSDEQLLGDGTGNTGWPYDSQNTVLGGYMPNSMQGADIYFNTENPATGKPFYLNTVNIAHAGGDLTIGVKCSATNLWILWDNFTLKYLGSDNLIPLLEEIEEKGIELEDIAASGAMTDKASELVSDLQAKIEAADDITSSDEALALISDIKDAIEYIKEGHALLNEITPLVEDYSRMYEELSLDDPAFNDLLSTLGDKVAEYETFADNEEIAQAIDDLKKGWIPAVVNSAEEGDELQGIILNPTFDSNANHWTITGTETDEEGNTITVGQNQGYQSANYSNGETGLTIDHFIEAWRPSTHLNNGTIAQTIEYALPEGYYQLQCDGYAVNQDDAGGLGEEELKGVYLWASCGGEEHTSSIVVQATSATPTTFTVDFHSNGTDLTSVGILVQDANCNWVAVDNFKLVYLGTEPPVAVEGIAAETAVAPKAIYTLDGRQTSTLRRGINIVRKADGSVQKVLVK